MPRSMMSPLYSAGNGCQAPARHSVQTIRLGAALGISACVHLLLLIWSPPVSPGGARGTGRPPAPALRATLKLAEVAQSEHLQKSGPAARPTPSLPHTPSLAHVGENGAPAASDGHTHTDAPLKVLGYFPVATLSRMPEAISTFDIRPPAGGDTGLDGRMTIRVWIGAGGAVEHAQLLSSGLPAAYEKAALEAFGKLRFKPGEIEGKPVPSWADVVIEYADFGR